MKFRIIKTKKEKSIEEIVNGLSKKPIEEKKTLQIFSKEFQPDILKITNVLVSSKNDTHIKVSEKMFELLRKKWDGVLTTSTTLTILFEDEEKRFRHKVSDIIEKISTKERSTDDYFNFIDMNKVGLD
jgi:hypothetical protein